MIFLTDAANRVRHVYVSLILVHTELFLVTAVQNLQQLLKNSHLNHV